MPEFLRLGLTGFPLGHSLSPVLHRAALRSAGLAGEYRLYPVQPLPEGEAALWELLDGVRRGELHGLNVTIPHKQAVLPLLDELTPAAQSIGAVNMISARGSRLVGDNSDAAGFYADLAQFLASSGWARVGQALVLGAGGSARAVAYALRQAGWAVTVAARRVEQARALAAAFDGEATPLDAAGLRAVPAPDLVVNTTPLGMTPHIDASPWPAELPLPRAAVYDLVYNPMHTRLVQAARAAGLPARGGLGMLVEQAALAFERWSGAPADRVAMRAAADGEMKGEP